ncbi:hypothetical protein [Crocosphaera sp.]|uniref:hypothetical protein n=1 Tax=Crocosphaera sp. TaxID=2729996 RepID=UPI003F2961B1|nr:hypothetical protein [Crocosphaera sp.]
MTGNTYQWTIEPYHQAIAAGCFADQRVELLRGEIIVMTIVDLNNHQLKVFRDLKQRNYTTELTLTEGNISPLTFPNVVIPVRKIISIN